MLFISTTCDEYYNQDKAEGVKYELIAKQKSFSNEPLNPHSAHRNSVLYSWIVPDLELISFLPPSKIFPKGDIRLLFVIMTQISPCRDLFSPSWFSSVPATQPELIPKLTLLTSLSAQAEFVKDAKYICKSCMRTAAKAENLCTPEPLKHLTFFVKIRINKTVCLCSILQPKFPGFPKLRLNPSLRNCCITAGFSLF